VFVELFMLYGYFYCAYFCLQYETLITGNLGENSVCFLAVLAGFFDTFNCSVRLSFGNESQTKNLKGKKV